MKNYKEEDGQIGNFDDEPHVPYILKQDKATKLVYERLEQLNRAV